MMRLSTAQRQSLPENIREHLSALYAENDNLAKQVRGLKAKNNELIREHIEMVKDKNSFGIQLQNQKLDIKRLTSLQSINSAKSIAENLSSKTQLVLQNERAQSALLNSGEATMSMSSADDRRMSSFFAITQLSDELARVAIRSPNIENIQPNGGPQIYDALNKRTSTVAGLQDIENAGNKVEKLQSGKSFSPSGCEAATSVAEDGAKIASKIPVRSMPTEASLTIQTERAVLESADTAAQGKSSRQRSQVNYKELPLNSKLRQGDDHSLKASQRTFQPTRGSNARDKTALKSAHLDDY